MILMRILPGVLKELSKHVPAVLFETVEWSELAGEIPKISRRIIQREGHDDLFEKQRALLDPYHIQVTANSLNPQSLKDNRSAGEKLLTLYFVQLFSPDGLFLDLRSQHFEADSIDLKWSPSGFWTKFEEPFRQGLLKVYEGFYLENNELYYKGLEEIGLLKKDFTKDDKEKLGNLFRAQFGEALNQDMKFELEHFRNSIIKMSDFMLSKKVTISKDFLYLGIYLVTLYSTLEETQTKLPVKQIYLDVRARFLGLQPQ